MHGWQANLKRTCALPVLFRALPENEIPPATCNSKIKVDTWETTMYLPFSYAKIYMGGIKMKKGQKKWTIVNKMDKKMCTKRKNKELQPD